MPEPNRQIFREQSLEKLSSPDRLDQLMRVIKPQGWIILLALGIGIALAITWGFVGRIPSNASGTAVLIHPKKVVAFQSPGTGQLYSIEKDVGDEVKEGEVIATIRLPDLVKELQLAKDRLDHFENRSRVLVELETSQAAEERKLIADRNDLIGERETLLKDQRKDIEDDAKEFLEKNIDFIGKQIKAVEAASALSEDLGTQLLKLQRGYEQLQQVEIVPGEGPVSIVDDVQVVDSRARTIANQLEFLELKQRLRDLEFKEFEVREAIEEKLEKVRDIEIQLKDLELELKDLELKEQQLDNKLARLRIDQESERLEITQRIDSLQSIKDEESEVKAKFAGTILEITAVEGQQVTVGTRLGRLEKQDETKLMALAFFSLQDGKKIKLGQAIRVSPSTAQRERYGGIVGKITRVSTYAVTTEAAASQIGDLEMARSLLRGENRIEVEIALLPNEEDADIQFIWTSGDGPKTKNDEGEEVGVEITAGTTADVRVTIEKRQPITLILPFLREILGT